MRSRMPSLSDGGHPVAAHPAMRPWAKALTTTSPGGQRDGPRGRVPGIDPGEYRRCAPGGSPGAHLHTTTLVGTSVRQPGMAIASQFAGPPGAAGRKPTSHPCLILQSTPPARGRAFYHPPGAERGAATSFWANVFQSTP